MASAPQCPLCEVVHGTRTVPGGVLLREGGFVLHALAGQSPVAGWLVLTSEDHLRALYSLPDEQAATLGRLCARVMRAQRAALGAEHVYQFAIGEQVHHCHVHLVPRYADTPQHLRGANVFSARPEELLGDEAQAEAARKVAAAL